MFGNVVAASRYVCSGSPVRKGWDKPRCRAPLRCTAGLYLHMCAMCSVWMCMRAVELHAASSLSLRHSDVQMWKKIEKKYWLMLHSGEQPTAPCPPVFVVINVIIIYFPPVERESEKARERETKAVVFTMEYSYRDMPCTGTCMHLTWCMIFISKGNQIKREPVQDMFDIFSFLLCTCAAYMTYWALSSNIP